MSSEAAKTAFSRFADTDKRDLYLAVMRPRISEKLFTEDILNGDLAEFAISNIAMEKLSRDRRGFIFETNRDEPALLIACPKGSYPDELLSDIYFTILDLLGIPVEFGVSAKGCFEQMSQMAAQARKALEASYIGGDAVIIHYGRSPLPKPLLKYPKETEKALLNSLLEDSPERSKELINEFFEAVKGECADTETCKSMIFRLLINIADQLEAMNFGSLAFDEQNELYLDPSSAAKFSFA